MSPYDALTDAQLIQLLKAGEEPAFETIYRRYWKRLFIVSFNKLKEPDEAEEIVQDIFVSLWKRKECLELSSTLNNYLAASAKYRVLKVLASRSCKRKYIDHYSESNDLLDNSTQEWLDFDEIKCRLSKLVGDLPEKCRLVYKLSRESGYSQKQIAHELGISEKTVEAHLGKALRTLRAGLNNFLLSVLL